jgi:hypothetical protein
VLNRYTYPGTEHLPEYLLPSSAADVPIVNAVLPWIGALAYDRFCRCCKIYHTAMQRLHSLTHRGYEITTTCKLARKKHIGFFAWQFRQPIVQGVYIMSQNTATATKSSGSNKGRKGKGKGNQAPAAVQAPTAPAAPVVVAPTTAPAANAKAPAIDTSKRIKLLVPNCPKRPGTTCYTRASVYWATYAKGGTVQQALDAGATRADIRWDLDHKFIELA